MKDTQKGESVHFQLFKGGDWEKGTFVSELEGKAVVLAENDKRLLFARKIKRSITIKKGDYVQFRSDADFCNFSEHTYEYQGFMNDLHVIGHDGAMFYANFVKLKGQPS